MNNNANIMWVNFNMSMYVYHLGQHNKQTPESVRYNK